MYAAKQIDTKNQAIQSSAEIECRISEFVMASKSAHHPHTQTGNPVHPQFSSQNFWILDM